MYNLKYKIHTVCQKTLYTDLQNITRVSKFAIIFERKECKEFLDQLYIIL